MTSVMDCSVACTVCQSGSALPELKFTMDTSCPRWISALSEKIQIATFVQRENLLYTA